MSERHEFASGTIDQKSLVSQLISNRSFYSKLNNVREFESIVDGLHTSDTIRAEFVDHFNIAVNWTEYSSLFGLITTGSYIMGVRDSLIGLQNSFYLDSPFYYNFDAIISSQENMQNAGFEFIYNSDLIMNTENRLSAEFISNDLTIDSSMTTSQFYMLSYYSGSLLSDMDSMTLDELSYVSV